MATTAVPKRFIVTLGAAHPDFFFILNVFSSMVIKARNSTIVVFWFGVMVNVGCCVTIQYARRSWVQLLFLLIFFTLFFSLILNKLGLTVSPEEIKKS